MIQNIFKKEEWFGNIKNDFLAGIVIAMALIPQSIAFSIIAGVDPKVALYASFSIAVIISLVGGRVSMISAATGAMALVIVNLVKEYGLQYLLAATILTGILQIILGYFKVGSLMSFVSHSVVIGFVNALAILIFMAQLPELINVSWYVYILIIFGLLIIYLFPFIPKIGKVIPSPLISIIILTLLVYVFKLDNIRTVADIGNLLESLPTFFIPSIPFNFQTLQIIFPYSFSLAIVGLLEALITTAVLDDITDTITNKNKECIGQGIANLITGFMGGMAGCAMIGLSVINVKSGSRSRLSTFFAGFLLLIFVVFFNNLISIIPMPALVSIMIMVSISTFDWKSFVKLKTYPISSNLVIFTTMSIILYTHNLAYGVLAGVLLASIFFINKISHFLYCDKYYEDNNKIKVYKFVGQIFFNSADKFINSFDFMENGLIKIIIDINRAHFWDTTAVYALDKVVFKLRKSGLEVKIIGQNEASATIIDRFGLHDKPEEIEKIMGGH